MNDENRVLRLLGVSNQQATHIRLVRGVVRVNPHLQVLCPTLANEVICRKGKKHKRGDYLRPKLSVKSLRSRSIAKQFSTNLNRYYPIWWRVVCWGPGTF